MLRIRLRRDSSSKLSSSLSSRCEFGSNRRRLKSVCTRCGRAAIGASLMVTMPGTRSSTRRSSSRWMPSHVIFKCRSDWGREARAPGRIGFPATSNTRILGLTPVKFEIRLSAAIKRRTEVGTSGSAGSALRETSTTSNDDRRCSWQSASQPTRSLLSETNKHLMVSGSGGRVVNMLWLRLRVVKPLSTVMLRSVRTPLFDKSTVANPTSDKFRVEAASNHCTPRFDKSRFIQ
mmetsp:Transcript_7432/g.23226  ORF Transcript_7432/g.23226 Transcript_7432/m.23226 type:complete len:233 (-) Transcript_7432:18-716(-)